MERRSGSAQSRSRTPEQEPLRSILKKSTPLESTSAYIARPKGLAVSVYDLQDEKVSSYLNQLNLASSSKGEPGNRRPEGLVPRPTDEKVLETEFSKPWVDQWASGCNYGPVLSPLAVLSRKVSLSVHPSLRISETAQTLTWDMIFPPDRAQYVPPSPTLSSDSFLNEPATFPRISSLQLVSRSFPWSIDVLPEQEDTGVTCLDVLRSIYVWLDLYIDPREVLQIPPERLDQMRRACASRRDRVGDDDRAVKKIDYLLGATTFAGLADDHRYLTKRFHAVMPDTIVLTCRR